MPNRKLIALVEDDQLFRESMQKLMRALGYTVEAFHSAANFLASPTVADTNCLVTDVNMPGMTGVELHRHLVDAGYAIPTILVTAYPNGLIGTGLSMMESSVTCASRLTITNLRAALVQHSTAISHTSIHESN
jgi:FixJ family two-component response regulator